MRDYSYLYGKKIGKWTIIGPYKTLDDDHMQIYAECECGKRKYVRIRFLKIGQSKSCGCKRTYKHGKTKTKIYRIWLGMIKRCYGINSHSYKRYGGRGIKVCKRWHKFENFYADMGERPDGKSLDRINNNKGYSKSNCRWADIYTQANNRRDVKKYFFEGKMLSIPQIARIKNISPHILKSRIIKLNWTLKEALNNPIRPLNKN